MIRIYITGNNYYRDECKLQNLFDKENSDLYDGIYSFYRYKHVHAGMQYRKERLPKF